MCNLLARAIKKITPPRLQLSVIMSRVALTQQNANGILKLLLPNRLIKNALQSLLKGDTLAYSREIFNKEQVGR